MKKSLIALAVLGAFAGAAVAQSSVTIYGIIDQGIQKANDGNAPNPGVTAQGEAWSVEQSTASRLGFRGNEDLGGGLSAQFQIEHRFNPDTGLLNAAAFWHGRSYVQLSGGFGSVYLGREYAPSFWIANKLDPFGWTTVGQIGGAGMAGFSVPGSGVRVANTVGYKTPKFGGFTANVDVGLGESPAGSRHQGLNVEYGAGPLYVGLGLDKMTNGAADGNSLINLGVAYDLGMIRPMVYFARSKLNNALGGEDTNKFVSLGAQAPIGPGKLNAMVYRSSPENNADETKFGIGYFYPLSKRTLLYVDASTARKKDTAAAGNFDNRNAFDLGVRHTF